MTTALFLDTMIYLHYRPVEQIDWPAEVREAGGAAEAVTLVVPEVTFDELDKAKNINPNRRTRDCARTVLRQLDAWSDVAREGGAPAVRTGVTAAFPAGHPAVDFGALGLDPAWADHVLVAAMIVYRAAHPDADVWLVTQDSGPRRRARDQGFRTLALRDALRRKADEDPLERDLRETRARLEKYERAQPKLSLRFAPAPNVQNGNVLTVTVTDLAEPPADRLRAAMKAAEARVPVRTAEGDAEARAQWRAEGNIAAILLEQLSHGTPSAAEYARYAGARERYLREFRQFLDRRWAEWRRHQLRFPLVFELSNDGSRPAEDIDVIVRGPDGVEVEEGELAALDPNWPFPRPPAPPEQPESEMQAAIRNFGASSLAPMGALSSVAGTSHLGDLVERTNSRNAPNVSSLTIRTTNSFEIEWHVQRLKHRFAEQSDPAIGRFAGIDEARSFTLSYSLHPANVVDPVEGELHVRVVKG